MYLTKVWLKFKVLVVANLLIGSVNCEFKSTKQIRNIQIQNHDIKNPLAQNVF